MHSVRENEFRVQNNQKKDMYVAFFKSAHTLLTLILHDSKQIFSRNDHLPIKQEFSSNARHRGN